MTPTLETVVADWRERAAHARRWDPKAADLITEVVDAFTAVLRADLSWLSEAEAMLYSGLERDTLRRRFPGMLRMADARWAPHGRRERQYKESALPRRADRVAVELDAREAARRHA